MRRSPFLRWLIAAALTPIVYVTSRVRPGVAAATSDMMDGMMCPENMRGPMRTGMELFERHADMRRSVRDVPGGIHAVTESDNPRTAVLIQEHVASMYARLDRHQPFPYGMSRSVPEMFAHSDRYQRTLTLLPKGIAVRETAADAEMVAVIRAHAREINGFVRDGMPAMMRDMM